MHVGVDEREVDGQVRVRAVDLGSRLLDGERGLPLQRRDPVDESGERRAVGQRRDLGAGLADEQVARHADDPLQFPVDEEEPALRVENVDRDRSVVDDRLQRPFAPGQPAPNAPLLERDADQPGDGLREAHGRVVETPRLAGLDAEHSRGRLVVANGDEQAAAHVVRLEERGPTEPGLGSPVVDDHGHTHAGRVRRLRIGSGGGVDGREEPAVPAPLGRDIEVGSVLDG